MENTSMGIGYIGLCIPPKVNRLLNAVQMIMHTTCPAYYLWYCQGSSPEQMLKVIIKELAYMVPFNITACRLSEWPVVHG